MHLLSYSRGGPGFGQLGRFDDDTELIDAMVEQYARLVKRALSRGLVHQYRETSDDLIALRGRPDVVDLVTRRFGVFPPVRCQFDEFTADTLPNRLMLAAAVQLGRSGVRSPAISALRAMEGRFEGVQLERFPQRNIPHPRLDRRYAHALPAVRMAEAILRRMSIELRDGEREAVTFLIDMNALYEDFIVEGLREALGLSAAEWVHHPRGLYLDTDRQLRLLPDALWKRRRKPLLVLDAKYKETDKPVRADIYQMVSYCQALDVRDAVLVYASTIPDSHVIVNSGVRVHRLSLDPNGTPAQIKANLRAVASSLRTLAA